MYALSLSRKTQNLSFLQEATIVKGNIKGNNEQALFHNPFFSALTTKKGVAAANDVGDGQKPTEEGLGTRVWIESRKLWIIVGPTIFSRVASFSMNVVTQAFAGHLGDVELAAFAIANNVIIGFNFGLLLGMASALETLCGQAYGAKRYNMLGIYMQRSWIVLFLCSFLLLPIYMFIAPILKFLGQPDRVAELSGSICIWLIPLHFSFAFQFPLHTWIGSSSRLVLLGKLVLQDIDIDDWKHGECRDCCGCLVSLHDNQWLGNDDSSGFLRGHRVRVANELGAGNGKAAKFATKVSVATSTVIGLIFCALIVMFHNKFAWIFTSSVYVLEAVDQMAVLLAITILLNSVQPVLSGVAIGSGWQSWVAYINLGCYYVIGLPLGIVLGWVFNLSVMGIWGGMIFGGTAVQTVILAIITIRCD